MVGRPRLLAVLRRRWSTPVVSVVAGAGFGKSTLLGQAVADNVSDPAGTDVWVTCTRESAVASVLARALTDALGVDPPEGRTPSDLAAAVAAVVAGRTPVPVCLVFDDAHVLAEDTGGAAFLAALVAGLPSNGRMLLSSRLPPPVPLAPLVARGSALCLDEADLAFTDDELVEFARLRGVDDDQLADAGRWPAIVELSASADRPVVRDFLWEELLDAMAPARRRALSAIDAIGGADRAGLTAALGGPADPVVAVAGLPLTTVSDAGFVQLHALWHEPLVAELTEQERSDVQCRAAEHALRTGDRLTAFRLFVDAAAWPGALTVVRDTCTPFVPPVDLDVLEDWLLAVDCRGPDAPEALLLRGVLLLARQTDLGESARLLDAARLAFREQPSAEGELACVVHRFSLAFLTRDVGALAVAMFEVIDLAQRGCVAARPLATIGRAGIAVAGEDHEGAIRELDTLDAADLDDPWWALRCWMYGEQLLALGRPAEALTTFAVGYDHDDAIAERLEDGRLRAAFIGGDVEQTLAIIDRVVARSQHRTCPPQGLWALTARIQAHLGYGDDADRSLTAARSTGEPADVTTAVRLQTADVVMAIGAGDEDAARSLLAQCEGAARLAVLRYPVVPYVLDATARTPWDDTAVGPALHEAFDFARALVALRERDDLRPVRALRALPPGPVRTALPLPWAAELAVAAEAVGHPDARDLVAALGPMARPWMERLRDNGRPPLAVAAKRLLSVVPAVPATSTEVHLLGPPELRHGGRLDQGPEWRRRRVHELLAFLVTHPTVSRQTLGDNLWPDLAPAAAANNLRVNLTHLLRALQPGRATSDACYFIAQGASVLSLRGHDHLRVDTWDLERHLDDGRRADAAGTLGEAREAYLAAVDCWRGPFLAEGLPAWAEGVAERLQAAFVIAAVRAGELSLAAGDILDAEALAHRTLAAHPWSEPAYRVLIAARLVAGDPQGAREVLAACRRMLAELGVAPAPETAMLERRLTVGVDP